MGEQHPISQYGKNNLKEHECYEHGCSCWLDMGTKIRHLPEQMQWKSENYFTLCTSLISWLTPSRTTKAINEWAIKMGSIVRPQNTPSAMSSIMAMLKVNLSSLIGLKPPRTDRCWTR